MKFSIQVLLFALVGVTLLQPSFVCADGKSSDDRSESDNVPLTQFELHDITAQVMAKQPLLSSSRGIKFAEATRITRWSEDVATIIYYPHAEGSGVKHAFQVECTRQIPNTDWMCEDATIRRYLVLDTQEYEVRVKGPISSEEAVALIEATRAVLPLVVNDGIAVPDTVMRISSYDDSATVVWFSIDGGSQLLMQGHLAEGGDPAKPDDWIVNRFGVEQ